MNKLFFFLLFLLIKTNGNGQSKVDSLLEVLEYSLENKNLYTEQKNRKIDSLKNILKSKTKTSEKFYLNGLISDNYRFYISDSAMTYIDKNRILSNQVANEDWKLKSLLQYSRMLSSVGIFNESQKILESVSIDHVDDSLQLLYYMACEELYVHLLDFIDDSRFRNKYEIELQRYRDSALKFIPINTAIHAFWEFKVNYMKGKTKEARNELLKCLKLVDSTSHLYAGANFCMSLFYNEFKNDQEKNKKLEYMIIAAISDIRSATKENFALISLSNTLFASGDIGRAYKYTHHALEDANYYNARYRNLQIGKMLPIIENAYQAQSNKQKKNLAIALVCISVLCISVLIAIYYIRKQMLSLSKARRILKKMNEQLKETNNSVNKVNLDLSESNKIKEFYIGHFLSLCSTYISKIEDFQKMLNKKNILEKKVSMDSRSASGATDIMEVELIEFYKNFDNAFLAIFPTFVEKFNELMREEEKIMPKYNELLTTELRIFALVKLGISDSNKIASLLRYSLTTIYSYRSRIKNKSLFPSDFEEKIKEIGSF